MSRLSRLVPRLIIATAVLHFVYAVAAPNNWLPMLRDGLFDTVRGQSDVIAAERHGDLWFLITGIGLLALGTMSQQTVRQVGRLPVQVGSYLLAIGTIAFVVEPVSGAVLVIALGVLAAIAARPSRAGAAAPAPPRLPGSLGHRVVLPSNGVDGTPGDAL
ncbi:DUF6463 family protein [Streptomyces sp. NPDC058613]|uniref:DUF6463 family protein n=1 Tax=unclassified Streptomyces TaxID=2593676 RepID=UPI00364D8E8B